MAKILVVFYTKGGNVRKMAEVVAAGVRAEGVTCDLAEVADVSADQLEGYDGIILGSPTYYGHPASEIKALIDESVKLHGRLAGKVGGAFSSCGVLGGGAETTVRAMLDALLIHGMVVQGTAKGAHYGPVAVGAPDEAATKDCRELGRRVGELVRRLGEE